MSGGLKIEKWLGRALLASGFGLMLLISLFAITAINDPARLHDPALLARFGLGFFVVTSPFGILTTALPLVRWLNRTKRI